jgi:hypothetical protein
MLPAIFSEITGNIASFPNHGAVSSLPILSVIPHVHFPGGRSA